MTLTRRYNGTPSQLNFVSSQLKLTQLEETTLVQWILNIDTRSISPTQALVHKMAKLLVAKRV
jgi:hypothetical protein